MIEREFYDLEEFSSKEEFLEKVTTYQDYFNFARPNSYKVFLDDYFREKFLGMNWVDGKIPVDTDRFVNLIRPLRESCLRG